MLHLCAFVENQVVANTHFVGFVLSGLLLIDIEDFTQILCRPMHMKLGAEASGWSTFSYVLFCIFGL